MTRIDTDSDFSTPHGQEPRGLECASEWNAGVETCARFVETRFSIGDALAPLAAQLRSLKRKGKAMTDKSDQLDGDGLRARLEEERNTLDNSFGRGIWADGLTRDRIRLIDEKLAALPSPTRDGAERELQASHGTVELSTAIDAGLAAILETAPPKPAPDAVRDDTWVLDTAAELSRVLVEKYSDEGTWRNVPAMEIVKAIDGFLFVRRAAPDGVGVVVDQILHQFENDDRTLYPDFEVILAIEKIQSALARSPAVAAEPVSDTDKAFIDAIYKCDMETRKAIVATMFGAVAAEPVAWRWRHDINEIEWRWVYTTRKPDWPGVVYEPLYASPTVRGDQEAVLRLLQASSCFGGEVCRSLPCACAESLSLPVQPGAGERS